MIKVPNEFGSYLVIDHRNEIGLNKKKIRIYCIYITKDKIEFSDYCKVEDLRGQFFDTVLINEYIEANLKDYSYILQNYSNIRYF